MLRPFSSLESRSYLQKLVELVDGDGSVIAVNDKKLLAPLRVKLKFKDTEMQNGPEC